MMDSQLLITWHCAHGHSGRVDLRAVAQRRGIDFSLVDKRSTCRQDGCRGVVHFRYSPGPGTPSRRVEALREREEEARGRQADREMRLARDAYNAIASRHGRRPLP